MNSSEVPGDRHFNPLLLNNPLRRVLEDWRGPLRGLNRGMIAADIGCGPGFYTEKMLQVVGDEGLVYASDSDRRSIEYLRSKLGRYRNLVLGVSDRGRSSFIPDSSVDFLLSKDVLCCTVYHREMLEDILRVLKRGGIAFISVRTGLGNDSRSVKRDEWENILSNFQVLERGKGITSLWARVRKA